MLRARRIRQRVLVARAHPDPERVRLQMHDALSTQLPEALRDAFARLGASDDDAVWRINRLSLTISVNTRWDDRRLARAWAAQLERAVRRAMERGGDGVTVVRFANRALYLASFVREMADGTAWSRWWFEEFRGLKLLSRTATIRTALTREPLLGVHALAAMSAADAGLVAAHLSAIDARTVIDVLAPSLEGGHADDASAAVVAAHRRLGRPSVRDDEERWVFRLVAESLRAAPRRTTRECVELARGFARLARVVDASAQRATIVRRLLAEQNVAALHLVIGADDAQRVAPLARLSGARIDAMLDALEESACGTEHDREDHAGAGRVIWMPIAAPLLLAPFVAALPLDEITSGWPSIGDADTPPMRRATAAALVRLVVLATACGGERAVRVVADPVTRLLAGVGSDVSTAQLHDWLASLTTDHAARMERMLGEWRIAQASVETQTWLLSGGHGQTTILLDCGRGYWLAARPGDDSGAGAHDAARSFQIWNERAAVLARSAEELATLAGEKRSGEAVAATLARIDRLTTDVEWLRLPRSLDLSAAFELALAVAAQGVLRDFAWRLPGFARASLPHLWTNFLAIDAHVEHEPERVAAVVARPPLAPVMSMSGMMRSTYRLPWIARDIALFPAEAP